MCPKCEVLPATIISTTGIAYAWHPHRDTWYSAPMFQINPVDPIYDFQSENAMAFHPRYWNHPVWEIHLTRSINLLCMVISSTEGIMSRSI